MDQQQHYVGLDVSLETTSICDIDGKGTAVWRGKCASTPEAIIEAVHTYAPAAVRVGLETGQLANWLTLNLRRRSLPVVCLDAGHAKAALSLQINKCLRPGTDRAHRLVPGSRGQDHGRPHAADAAGGAGAGCSARRSPTRSGRCSRHSAWSSYAAAAVVLPFASASRSPATTCW